MDTSRSQDRSMTPRKKRRGRDGTRESRDPLGTLGFKLKLSVDRCYKQYCYTLILLYIYIYIYIYIYKYLGTAIHVTTFFCIGYSPADETNEVPELPLQSSRKGNDTKEDEGEDHSYEPIPFDTPRQ